MSRASNLAGFSTSIQSVAPNNLVVGVVTATSFVGNVTGTATGLSGSPNVTVGFITATEYDITGSTNTLNADGLNVGVATATTLKVGTGVTISAGVITATSSITIGSTDVLTAINAKASTGKAIAMAIVFG